MPARRIKTSCADMVQSLDQTEHRDRPQATRDTPLILEPQAIDIPVIQDTLLIPAT